MKPSVVRPLEWKAHFGASGCLRPEPMASADCPVHQEWVGITRCNACPAVRDLNINYEDKAGEVNCYGQ